MARTNGLKRSLEDFKRHPWLHFMSVTTVMVALIIIGVFLMGYRNYQVMSEGSESSIVGTAYLTQNITSEQLSYLQQQIESLESVRSVSFKGEQEVLNELNTFMGNENLNSLGGQSIFPDLLEIQLDPHVDQMTLSSVKAVVSNSPFVVETDFSEAWFSHFKRASKMLKIVGLFLIFGILFACSFIIANFMGMRLQTRKKEIEIIQLMGADRRFILIPFLWEGMIEGLCGSVMALAALFAMKTGLSIVYSAQWSKLLGLTQWQFLSFGQVLFLLTIGIAMSFFGSVTIFLRMRESH